MADEDSFAPSAMRAEIRHSLETLVRQLQANAAFAWSRGLLNEQLAMASLLAIPSGEMDRLLAASAGSEQVSRRFARVDVSSAVAWMLAGRADGVDPVETMFTLGREETLRHLEAALEKLDRNDPEPDGR